MIVYKMGNLCSCFREKKYEEYNDHLIRHKHCYKCQVTYLSNYEYNRHIVECNSVHGDM